MFVRFIAVAFALATPSFASAQTEWLIQAPLPDLQIGHQVERNGSMIVEMIPPGETVQAWTRMVTTQRFAGVVAGGLTLSVFHERFTGGLATGCPGARETGPRYFELEHRPALEFRIDCARNPQTGLPETLFLRAIAGARDLHVVQVAFRSVPNAADTEWAQSHIGSALLCTPASRNPACAR